MLWALRKPQCENFDIFPAKLISRKMWVSEKFINFHTVKCLPSKPACILYQYDSKPMENRPFGKLCKIRDLEIFSSFSLSWVSVVLLSKYLGINLNFSMWRLQCKVLEREFRSGFTTFAFHKDSIQFCSTYRPGQPKYVIGIFDYGYSMYSLEM